MAARSPAPGSPPAKKRRPPEPESEETLAAKRQVQAEWEARNKADKKRRELQLTLILLFVGALAIGLLIFFLAN